MPRVYVPHPKVYVPPRPLVLKLVRFPASLHRKLVQRAKELSAETGKPVSVNQVILDMLEAQFDGQAGKRGKPRKGNHGRG